MRERITYICDICGAEYSDKYQCELCENFHKKPIEIVGSSHYGAENKYLGYPARVRIKMSDGSVIEYKPSWED